MKSKIRITQKEAIKIEQILDAIRRRRSLDESKRSFEFELGGFKIKLNNKNDYLELIDILEGLQEKAGMEYKISRYYFDSRGQRQAFTLYSSILCGIIIKDIRRFENYHDQLKKIIKNKRKILDLDKEQPDLPNKQNQRYLITRDKTNGDFYYKNKLIKFDNKDTIYYLIFECLYTKGDLKGFCFYESINRYLEKQGQERLVDNQKIKDRIKNGLENLFRFTNLPRKAPDGKKIIQKSRGKGITLYNPPI